MRQAAPQPKQPGGDQRQADHQRQRCRQQRVFVRAGRGDQREAAGEDRRDRRIGTAAEKAVSAECGEAKRAGQEGEEADLLRKSAEMCGRHLRRNGDRHEAQSGGKIGGKEARLVAAQRGQECRARSGQIIPGSAQ
jgi:hypothetical protein